MTAFGQRFILPKATQDPALASAKPDAVAAFGPDFPLGKYPQNALPYLSAAEGLSEEKRSVTAARPPAG